MTTTRKLPTRVDFRAIAGDFHHKLNHTGGFKLITYTIGLGFTALLLLAVWAAAVQPRGTQNAADMGRWAPLINPNDAAFAIGVDFNPESGRVQLLAHQDALREVVADTNHRSYILGHVERFNNAARGRRYQPNLIPRDCLFWVSEEPKSNTANKGDRRDQPPAYTVLEVRDLSAFNTFPIREQTIEPMGAVYLRPSKKPVPVLSDGYLSLFPTPENSTQKSVDLSRSGLFSAGILNLTDAMGQPKAQVTADPAGTGVNIRAGRDARVFIDNNAPETNESIALTSGDIVEIAGRFFETRIEEGGIVATSSLRGNREKRLYPMGADLHFIGPVSLTGAHQSLGLEYMLREYLKGDRERGIPQGKVWLTIDPTLQSELSANVRQMSQFSKVKIASGLIMNAKTGAILAMSAQPVGYDPGNTDQILKMLDSGRDRYANHGCFKRHVIGSVTKPFFAFTAMHLIQDVTDMRIQLYGADSPTLFGHNLYGQRTRKLAFDRNLIDFSNYLVLSDNAYQHSLGMLLLSGSHDLSQVPKPWRSVDKKNRLVIRPNPRTDQILALGDLGTPAKNHLHISPDNAFAATIRDLFEIQTGAAAGKINDRDLSIYGSLIDTAAAVLQTTQPTLVDPHKTLLARSSVCAPETPRMELEAITNTMDASNLLFGANLNFWTDVKACEAFSRMMTGTRVRARLIAQYLDTMNPTEDGTPALVNLEEPAPPLQLADGSEIETWIYDRLKRDLEQVSRRGTAKLLAPTIREIQKQPGMKRFKLFGKTGTIDDGKPDSKLFMGTFGLWNPDTREFDGPALTFILYLKNALDEDAVLKTIRTALPAWVQYTAQSASEPI